jgi:hypothetical protein
MPGAAFRSLLKETIVVPQRAVKLAFVEPPHSILAALSVVVPRLLGCLLASLTAYPTAYARKFADKPVNLCPTAAYLFKMAANYSHIL